MPSTLFIAFGSSGDVIPLLALATELCRVEGSGRRIGFMTHTQLLVGVGGGVLSIGENGRARWPPSTAPMWGPEFWPRERACIYYACISGGTISTEVSPETA